MMNKFEKCNSLAGLYLVMANPEVTFQSLNEVEKDTVYKVYCDNKGTGYAMLSTPLTEDGYTFIFEQVSLTTVPLIAIAKKLQAGDGRYSKLIARLQSFYGTGAVAISNSVVHVGQDYQSFVDGCDAEITNVTQSFGAIIEEIGYFTGLTQIKEWMQSMVYDYTKGAKSRRGFFDCASEINRFLHSYINAQLSRNPDETKLKDIAALRYMLGEDEEGNPTGRRSIFEVFANTVVWICKKVTRKLREWFGTDAESNIFGSVGAGIASVLGVAFGLIKDVLKIAVHFVILISSYALSAILKAFAWVVDTISGWKAKAKEKFSLFDKQTDEEEDKAVGVAA